MAAASPAPAPASAGASSEEVVKSKRWLPLESNPDLMNKYAESLGFPTAMYQFHEIFSTEDWALEMIPAPVIAVVFLYPIKDSTEAHRAAEKERIAKDGQEVSDKLYYTKQTIGNACGTIGLLHAIANVSDLTGGDVPLAPGKWWHSFVSKTKDMSADDKAAALEADEELEEEHKKTATDESAAVLETEDVYTHFIAFVQKDGCLYELDGRKDSPINHGASSKDSVLKDSMKVMREFMARDEGEIRFTMLALAPAAE
ncbi:hypothetical protein FNF29_01918 [Cafeteria roenbergensis]|uniref:Ubiquitin carboxyl-terminal hydrolase n=1 Tax=Cafeteria roenbergensis TaxID=33653 RepID=A0A5A8D9B5_CAFRO|nr:hypothetical protein FNF29_01918 [Cafeteria roenbergensis]KAA0161795.1 hypothetical protein FNF31_03581 [Cafeteria roenbergensis]KAA0166404.1 hypothetical protein FNF28_03173 [Cafeteria roenbergensis]|eukprot:KAA0155167.1 hypothetical protein FNF29_01918 [Cafeteria roenbergensis]